MSIIAKEPAYTDRTETWMRNKWSAADFRPAMNRCFGVEPVPRNPFDGICVGANVTVLSTLGRQAGFQVWAHGKAEGSWWVANGVEFLYAQEADLILVGQCGGEQLALDAP